MELLHRGFLSAVQPWRPSSTTRWSDCDHMSEGCDATVSEWFKRCARPMKNLSNHQHQLEDDIAESGGVIQVTSPYHRKISPRFPDRKIW